MSTVYYFVPDMERLYKDLKGSPMYEYVYEVVGEQTLLIGKRSLGWKPLFHGNNNYKSVKQIKEFYESNSDIFAIEDEYGEQLTMEQLQEQLFNWNKDNEDARQHLSFIDVYFDGEGNEFTNSEFL